MERGPLEAPGPLEASEPLIWRQEKSLMQMNMDLRIFTKIVNRN